MKSKPSIKDDKKFIIWTRSLEDWPKDQLLLQSYKIEALHIPCVETRKIDHTFKDFAGTTSKAAVFTSLRAGIYALESPVLAKFLKDARIFCFGQKVKLYFESRNFHVEDFGSIRSACEIPDFLKDKISRETFLVFPGPRKRAFDLEAAFESLGFKTESIDLYETDSKPRLSEKEKGALISQLSGTVFFASPSACEGFVECFFTLDPSLSSRLKVLVLGPTTGAFCKHHFKNVQIASENNLAKALSEFNP